MRIKSFFFSCCLCLLFQLNAQQGYQYLTNYTIPIPNTDYQNFAAIQGKRGIMYFANKKGVLTYDGVNWRLLTTPGTPYSLAIDTTGEGRIYVGCAGNYGYLNREKNGTEYYVSISDSLRLPGDITDIEVFRGTIYFYSSRRLIMVNTTTNKLQNTIQPPRNSTFSGFFIFRNTVYLNAGGYGLMQLRNGRPMPVPGGSQMAGLNILSACSFDKFQFLLAANNGILYLFNGRSFTKFNYEVEEYIKGNTLNGCLSLDDKKLALATAAGGCALIEKKTGRKLEIINFQSGLPDDEVISLCSDNKGGLWICNMYAISRADITLPVQNFSAYPGLEGNIASAIYHNRILYVATNEGLYYLGKVTNAEEVQDLIKKEHSTSTQTQVYRTMKSVTKLIRVTFSGRDNPQMPNPITKEIPITIEVPVDSVSTSVKEMFTDKQIRQNYAMQSIPFVFKKIKGIDGKCRQLVAYQNRILVASSVGVFEVDSIRAYPVIKDINVNFIAQALTIPNTFYIGTNSALFAVTRQAGWAVTDQVRSFNAPVFSIAEERNTLWIGSENRIYRIRNTKGRLGNFKVYPIRNNFTEAIIVRRIREGMAFFSASGVYRYDNRSDAMIKDAHLQKYYNPSAPVLYNQPGNTWVNINSRWTEISGAKPANPLKTLYLHLFQNVIDVFTDIDNNYWVVEQNSLYKINTTIPVDTTEQFKIYIKEIKDKKLQLLPLTNAYLKYNNNAISVNVAALYYLSEKNTMYSYWMEGLYKGWSDWSTEPFMSYNFLPSGGYKLHIKAKNIFDQHSNEIIFPFRIGTPFWKTWWFILFVVLSATILISGGILLRLRQLEQARRILEQKVNEATAEIRKQKDQLQDAFNEIEKKNKDITASINYAERIQRAFLPWDDTFKAGLPESFVIYRPRDIVSGDFYWYHEEKEYIVVIAADCTGHGVPGAFMSMIGNTLLNEIIKERRIIEPNKILINLDKEVITALRQDRTDSKTRDGMDISVCTIYKNKNMIEFAAANNPLYYTEVGGAEMQTVRGEILGIGGYYPDLKKKEYPKHTVRFEKDTCFYIFSDGYADQNGGPDNKKFMSGRFRQMLFDVHREEFDVQKKMIEDNLDNWKGNRHQRDDILVIGFKLRAK